MSFLRSALHVRMAPAVVASACVLLLGSCSGGTPAADPATGTLTVTAEATTEFRGLGVFAGEGTLVDPTPAIAVSRPREVREWAQELALPDDVVADLTRMARRADVAEGETLAVGVLHVGCAIVEDYTVEVADGLVRLVAEVPDSTVDCDELVTSVGLVVVAADLFGAGR